MSLATLNTKAVGYAGILSFVIGLLTDTAFQSQVTKLVGAQGQGIAALVFIIAGFAAGYYGMPHTVTGASK